MRRSLLLVPLVVLVIASCGSDDDDAAPESDATATAPPTELATTAPPATTPPPAPTIPAAGSLRPSESTIVREAGPSAASSLPPSGPMGTPQEAEAVADLAQRQGVAASAITIVSVDDVTWRDGSIGCPQPGMGYTQALVSGTRVILELDGTRYEYHDGGPRSIFLCENPEPPLEG